MASSSNLTRKLTAITAATTNDAAHIDIPYPCRVLSVDWSILPTAYATGDYIIAEVAVVSVGQQVTNDAQGIISECVYALSTAVGSIGQNHEVQSINVQLPAGTRVYLHVYQNGTSNTRSIAILTVQPL